MTSSVQKDGITILGAHYHSEYLAEAMLRRRDRKLTIQWYSEDIGAIAVEIHGEWIEIPSVFARHRGVRAQTWLATQRALRTRFKHETMLEEHIVHQVIDDIERINGDAMIRIGFVVEGWSVKRLQNENKKIFIGFKTEPDAGIGQQAPNKGGFGEDFIPPANADHKNVSDNFRKSDPTVSVPSSAYADPSRTKRQPSEGDVPDGPQFEIEDK